MVAEVYRCVDSKSELQVEQMKRVSKLNDRGRLAQAIAIATLLFALCFGGGQLASADIGSDTDISTGPSSIQDINPNQPGEIVKNYDKRNLWMAHIRQSDTLQQVAGQGQDSNATTRLQESQDNFTPQIGQFPALMQVIPNYTNGFYYQPYTPEIQVPPTKKDCAIFKDQLTTSGLPLSDTQYQIIARANIQRKLEMQGDPERTMWTSMNQAQLQGASASNSFAGAANSGFQGAVSGIQGGYSAGGGAGGGSQVFGSSSSMMGSLINIANENAGTPTASDSPWKPVSGAVWMVQQMYKFVFTPMAILFLLPGAVLTQVKGQVTAGILGQQGPSPFEGILRAMIAVFLIPATQLIMSYAIDVGNSLTYSVSDYVDTSVINSWTQQTIYDVPVANVDNAIMPPSGSGSGGSNSGGAGSGSSGSNSGSGVISAADSFITSSLDASFGSSVGGALAGMVTPGLNSAISGILGDLGIGGGVFSFGAGGDGLSVDTPDGKAIQERQLWTSQTMELVLNMAIYALSIAVLILGAYQLVFMCYLFLLGPLAAAFFAWPVLSGSNPAAPNSNVFSGWVDAVICVSLWRFYWMVILAIMTQRILWMMDTGQKLNLQWEVTVFICLLGLMLYVPFHPFDYDPGKAFTQAMSAGQSLAQAAGPAAGQAASAAGVPQSQINAVGQAFNQVNPAISNLTQNQIGSNMEAARGQAGVPGSSVGPGDIGKAPPSGPSASNNTGTTPTQQATAPPTAGNPQQVADAGPNASGTVPNSSPSPSTANATVTPNANASGDDQIKATPDTKTAMAAADHISDNGQAPPPSTPSTSTDTRSTTERSAAPVQVADAGTPQQGPPQSGSSQPDPVAGSDNSKPGAKPSLPPPDSGTAIT